jgi:hypothetical protein
MMLSYLSHQQCGSISFSCAFPELVDQEKRPAMPLFQHPRYLRRYIIRTLIFAILVSERCTWLQSIVNEL